MWAFGPLFVDREEAETFLLFVAARGVQDLRARGDREIEWLYAEFTDLIPLAGAGVREREYGAMLADKFPHCTEDMRYDPRSDSIFVDGSKYEVLRA